MRAVQVFEGDGVEPPLPMTHILARRPNDQRTENVAWEYLVLDGGLGWTRRQHRATAMTEDEANVFHRMQMPSDAKCWIFRYQVIGKDDRC